MPPTASQHRLSVSTDPGHTQYQERPANSSRRGPVPRVVGWASEVPMYPNYSRPNDPYPNYSRPNVPRRSAQRPLEDLVDDEPASGH
eukprot:CAMPEP_0180131692 /NCGR_PEP_ID=MMETSP0986-20121125/8562_1 /TAXON_ID=697907 /ORGANISM="non described non described, Strain CCMP2293" /LENGTH=86 /DNA_ID=CAMNT_0022071599 /DNA_START=43 /DNA_END=303 /DNA_ORIENTATION=+